MKTIAVHGHRGARGRRPENTIEAFTYAIDAGADAIELDVVLTRDLLPVVAHDPVDRRAPHMPTLPEVLALAGRRDFLFNIELKPHADAAALVALVLPMIEPLQHRVLFQSFDFGILHELERSVPQIPRSALFEDTSEGFVAIARRAHADAVSPEYTLVTEENVRAAHAAGLQVLTWTPNGPKEWRVLIDAGVDAIITDDPAALLEYLGRP